MLYQLHEAQRAVLNPLSTWADAMSQLYANPYSPFAYSPFANRASAGFELIHRLGKDYEKPEFGITEVEIDGQKVTVQQRIELDKPFCRLLKFERLLPARLGGHADDPKLLLFAPLSGHHATLLRDTVRALIPDHEVYVTDWMDARFVPLSAGRFNLDDYIGYAIEFMRLLGPDVHVVSVCQPTVPVLAAISIMAAIEDEHIPLSMTMMGGPIDTRKSPTEVNALAIKNTFEWFERNLIYVVPAKYPGAGRKVYPGFLQHAGFVSMNPDRHVNSHWDFYMNLVRGDLETSDSHRDFYDEYNAVLDMPAEYYLSTIQTVFQDHLLPTGKWDVQFEGDTHRVDPAAITNVALFTIEGELDDISGPGQTQAAHKLCANIPQEHQQDLVAEGAGHYGIFSGRRWRERICPEVGKFIRAHRTRIGAKPARAARPAAKRTHKAA
ncbi:MAG: polyhydroxyalkanoate depolymerase [Burkholderiaceae bacterium]